MKMKSVYGFERVGSCIFDIKYFFRETENGTEYKYICVCTCDNGNRNETGWLPVDADFFMEI